MSHVDGMRRSLLALGAGVPLVGILALVGFGRGPTKSGEQGKTAEAPSIAKIFSPSAAVAATAPPPSALAGIDLTKLSIKDDGVTAAFSDKRVAKLSLDPELQREAEGLMAMHRIPEAAVVLMEVQTGRVLVYASHVEKGPPRDICVEAAAPAASVFKVVTGAALVETAGFGPEHRECYSGGEQRIHEQDLVPDPKRDRWCTTLAGAMGRSINTVFARLAQRNLKPVQLEEMARSLGFGSSLPFDVPVQAGALRIPDDSLGFARTSAGFWNTTLSPLHAAWLSATVARGGEPVRPTLVTEVLENGKVQWSGHDGIAQKRAMKPETAQALTTMMDSTVTDGTSFKAFHDTRGRAFLPSISVAGKTGTLTDGPAQRFYTWFTGFAPSKAYVMPEGSDGEKPPRQVAVGVLVVNEPTWQVKANVLAREVLRAYFASQKVPNVTTPLVRAPGEATKRAGQGSTTPATKQRRQRGS